MKKRFATKPGTGDPAQPIVHEGGCLCEDIRYKTTAAPVRVTICHCTFCQKITGLAFLVEPIFDKQDVVFAGRAPRAYGHRSDSSHKRVAVNFCGRCGTPIYLELERSPDVYGLFGGSFDNPNWFDRNDINCRHIFTRSAQDGVVLPAGSKIFTAHAQELDGTLNQPIVLTHALIISRKQRI